MVKTKEFKGTTTEPNVDDLLNMFFEECDDSVEILNLMYSTSAVPSKNEDGNIVYRVISSCLVFYNEETDEEADEE